MVWATVDIRVLDVSTAEFEAFEVEVSPTGIEILFFQFVASARDIARAVAHEIVALVPPKM